MKRTAEIHRVTKETDIFLSIDLDGTGLSSVDTGIGFFDHMLASFAKHGFFDLELKIRGDLQVDTHHTIEDGGIVLGQGILHALGDKAGIRRYGDATVPLDEALAQAVVDVSGRPYFVHEGESEAQRYHLVGGHFTGSMTGHALESLAFHAGLTMHVRLLAGRDPHHIVEAQFKAVARALRTAVEPDPRSTGVPSTKGAL